MFLNGSGNLGIPHRNEEQEVIDRGRLAGERLAGCADDLVVGGGQTPVPLVIFALEELYRFLFVSHLSFFPSRSLGREAQVPAVLYPGPCWRSGWDSY